MAEQRREDLRAADADRQFVAQRLQEALNEGRLTLTEYDERLQQAYAARTYGELDGILDDLPAVIPPQQAQVATVADAAPTQVDKSAAPPARRGVPTWLVVTWGSWLTASLVCWTIWLATGMEAYPWPVWVSGPWGAILLARTLMAMSSGDPERYMREHHDRERERHERKRDRREWDRERRDRSHGRYRDRY